MNQEQILSLVRTVLQVLMTILVTHGLLTTEDAASLTGAIMVAGPAVVLIATTMWGLYARRSAGLVAATAALPQVGAVIAAPALAAAVPAGNVVASVAEAADALAKAA